ncbi:hypothetical protein pb186bvf_007640 [Paramecium bursaria]
MLSKFEFILKQFGYKYTEQIILGGEQRILCFEYLLQKHSITFYEYFQYDHRDQEQRIKSIKCHILVLGVWGQSKHGKNVDLNKLITGNCTYDQSLAFIYKVAKCIYNMNSTDNEFGLLKELLQHPHQVIIDHNPFPVAIPKNEEYQDLSQVTIEQEIQDIIQFQQSDLQKLETRVLEQSVTKLGQISDSQINSYVEQLKLTNQAIQKLKNKENILQQIKIQNEVKDSDKYTLKFPQLFNDGYQEYKELTDNINSALSQDIGSDFKQKYKEFEDETLQLF